MTAVLKRIGTFEADKYELDSQCFEYAVDQKNTRKKGCNAKPLVPLHCRGDACFAGCQNTHLDRVITNAS